jgi:diadenosine tetraphosphatase ApaH/serine/threonine PP2A family protein phosphatase
LADIHANMAALEAVMADAHERGAADEVWCLGDLVGYGPDPGECIRLVRDACTVCVAGNHDLAAAGTVLAFDFNAYAAEAIAWTRDQLTWEDRNYLAGLPLKTEKNEFTIVHGSPRDPTREYVDSTQAAEENFSQFRTRYCLVGHTHIPLAFSETKISRPKVQDFERRTALTLGQRRLILNPGAVGQPRDGDPRASYAVVDTEKRQFKLRRVAYDIEAVQKRMREHSLPQRLIERLATGT